MTSGDEPNGKLWEDLFDQLLVPFKVPEQDMLEIKPGGNDNELRIKFVRNHFPREVTCKLDRLSDLVWSEAITWLNLQHKSLVAQLTSLAATEFELARLQEENARLRQQIFGTSSEKSAELEIASPATEMLPQDNHPAKTTKPHARAGGRKPLPANLPREDVLHELEPVERACSCCNGLIHPIGEEVTEQLTVIPAKFKVWRHIRTKYVCRSCGKFVTAPGAKPIIEKSSYASADFLAHVATQKYQFGLPFYRQETIFANSGFSFNRTTLASLMIGCSDRLTALYECLRENLLNQRVIQADETTVQVLKERDRTPQSKSQLWLFRSSVEAMRPIVLFDYQTSRSGEHPKRFLGHYDLHAFKGYLQVDGYAGYNKIPDVIRVACMAHIRRKFAEVVKSLPRDATGSPAHEVIDLIAKLYAIEKRLKGLDHRIRYKTRQRESIPILESIKSWLDDMKPKVTPSSGLGKAIGYALSQWDFMLRYVEDGELSIDNNIAEREIKAVVIGRKNWLFADTPDGMRANAVMYSLVQTAKANGIDPFVYLRYVIDKMPTLKSSKDVECLLPWNMPAADLEERKLAA